MQISENLLRVIFMLSTIVAVTDCCSSRLLLLKEHTLQIVQQQQQRLHNIKSADYDYDIEDFDQLQQQQQQHHRQQQLEQQQQQRQKIPQYVEIVNSELEFNKNFTDEHTRSRDDDNDEKSTETQFFGETIQLGNFGSDSFESLLGIFDAAAFETTTTTTTTTATTVTTGTAATTATAIAKVESAAQTTTSTETTTIETTTALESTTLLVEESSTRSESTSTSVVGGELTMEPSSTTTTTRTSITTPTTAASPLVDGVESVMNELKSVRDLLSLPCSGQFLTEFCLNHGRCFRYPIGNDTIHSCICADGYIGERCESKSMNGSFVPSIAGAKKQKILMARIVFSFPMLVALSVIYIMIGAAVVFKRPAASPPPAAHISAKERLELMPDDDAGEFIMMNSYPIAAGSAASYSAYAD